MYDHSMLQDLEEGWFFYDHAWLLLHELIKQIKGSSLLDVGCGTAIALSIVKAVKPHLCVQGLEPSSDASPIWGMRGIDVKVGSATAIPFQNNEFDTVISSHVIEHIQDDLLALKEILRVAKQRAIIVVPFGNVDEKNPGTPHLHYYNRINFKKLLNNGIGTDHKLQLYSLPHHHIDNLIAIIDKTHHG